MRDEYKPGDLSVRLSFGRVYGTSANRGQIKPAIEITDQTSGRVLIIDITAAELAEMLGGGAAEVPADRVQGFRGVGKWGRYLKTTQRLVKGQTGDYEIKDGEGAKLPHIAKVIAEIEADGYRCDSPRRNNSGQWVIIGRRYDEKP